MLDPNNKILPSHLPKKQAGLSLLEILMALAIGIFLLLGASSFFISNLKTQTNNLRANTLNQDIRQATMFITRDLRRAGYSADIVTNAFNGIRLCKSDNSAAPCAELNTNATDHCILYRYDRNKNGGAADNDELLGFSLVNNQIFYRSTGNNMNNCASDANNIWVPLTDSSIRVTQLKFCYLNANTDTNANALPPAVCSVLPTGGARITNLAIYIEAELSSDASVKTRTIEVIRLFNAPIRAS
jgi:type II secretory pathway component PulJ